MAVVFVDRLSLGSPGALWALWTRRALSGLSGLAGLSLGSLDSLGSLWALWTLRFLSAPDGGWCYDSRHMVWKVPYDIGTELVSGVGLTRMLFGGIVSVFTPEILILTRFEDGPLQLRETWLGLH